MSNYGELNRLLAKLYGKNSKDELWKQFNRDYEKEYREETPYPANDAEMTEMIEFAVQLIEERDCNVDYCREWVKETIFCELGLSVRNLIFEKTSVKTLLDIIADEGDYMTLSKITEMIKKRI